MTANNSFALTPEIINNVIDNAARYGEVNQHYIERSAQVISNALNEYRNIFVFRVDLRFPYIPDTFGQTPTLNVNKDDAVITRFFESLKAQLRASDRRKEKAGIRVHPSKVRYIWVREQNNAPFQHYHCLILLNKDAYAFLGQGGNEESVNMANRIKKAWASALGVPWDCFNGIVFFPQNTCYYIDRNEWKTHGVVFNELMERVSYLAKTETKPVGQGYRVFGCSQS